jgi:hypothetical protein
VPAAIKNIENNPMQSSLGIAGMDAVPYENILTRRANQRHYCIITPFAELVRNLGPIRHQHVACCGLCLDFLNGQPSRHCEEQSDEAIHLDANQESWIASLRSQ